MKKLQRQLEFLEVQEEYIKDEQKNLKKEYLHAQEEVKRIQSVPLVIGQFLEAVDQNTGIVGSTTGLIFLVFLFCLTKLSSWIHLIIVRFGLTKLLAISDKMCFNSLPNYNFYTPQNFEKKMRCNTIYMYLMISTSTNKLTVVFRFGLQLYRIIVEQVFSSNGRRPASLCHGLLSVVRPSVKFSMRPSVR